MKVRFLKLADQELADAVNWYDQQMDGLEGIPLMNWIERLGDWLPSLYRLLKLSWGFEGACWHVSRTV
jgi:hypothetical protein